MKKERAKKEIILNRMREAAKKEGIRETIRKFNDAKTGIEEIKTMQENVAAKIETLKKEAEKLELLIKNPDIPHKEAMKAHEVLQEVNAKIRDLNVELPSIDNLHQAAQERLRRAKTGASDALSVVKHAEAKSLSSRLQGYIDQADIDIRDTAQAWLELCAEAGHPGGGADLVHHLRIDCASLYLMDMLKFAGTRHLDKLP
jgi:chromosome segregation ATPase